MRICMPADGPMRPGNKPFEPTTLWGDFPFEHRAKRFCSWPSQNSERRQQQEPKRLVTSCNAITPLRDTRQRQESSTDSFLSFALEETEPNRISLGSLPLGSHGLTDRPD